MKKRTVFFVLLLALLIALALAGNIFLAPRVQEGEKTITVEVEHLNGEKNEFRWQTDEQYLRGAMEEIGIIEGREDTYGLWVTSVDDETADETKEQWWGYTVNGQEAVYGVDTQPVNDGDTFVFTLHVGY